MEAKRKQTGFHEFIAFIIRRGTSDKEVQDIVSAIGNYGSSRPLASTKNYKS
jgi:hypothetical protein